MLSLSDSTPVSSIFIRECYITWFGQFITGVKQHPRGKFALSSSPGCGKTISINFIFKMIQSVDSLSNRPILYQFKQEFIYIKSDQVFNVGYDVAVKITLNQETIYILDGRDANPLSSRCLTLFISSPRSNSFKDWTYQAQITPLYFPVWSFDELLLCRELCYKEIDKATVKDRYNKYGGIARYVFWSQGQPPSIEGVVADRNARNSIRAVGDLSQLFPSSHMLLHLHVDESLNYRHIVLASRYIGVLLFSKYFDETLETLQSLLGDSGALAGHLFECYVHFIFEYGRDTPLACRPLGTHHSGMHCILSLK
jgi:hypothetical protein